MENVMNVYVKTHLNALDGRVNSQFLLFIYFSSVDSFDFSSMKINLFGFKEAAFLFVNLLKKKKKQVDTWCNEIKCQFMSCSSFCFHFYILTSFSAFQFIFSKCFIVFESDNFPRIL